MTENARVPVVQHYKGVCHLFLDASADVAMAVELVKNGKLQRPSACNALECLLVHRDSARELLPPIVRALTAAGCELRGDPEARSIAPEMKAATDDDWGNEFLDLVLAVKVVGTLDEAMAHVAKYGSGHTEAICTRDDANATRWTNEVDAACVVVNASTRFHDGGELGARRRDRHRHQPAALARADGARGADHHEVASRGGPGKRVVDGVAAGRQRARDTHAICVAATPASTPVEERYLAAAKRTGGRTGSGGSSTGSGTGTRTTPARGGSATGGDRPRLRSSHTSATSDKPAKPRTPGARPAGPGAGASKKPGAKRPTTARGPAAPSRDRDRDRERSVPRPRRLEPATPLVSSGPAAAKLKKARTGPANAAPPSSLASDRARSLAITIAVAALDKKAVGIEILDVAGRVDYADFLVLMTGRSDRQVVALAQGIEESLREKGTRPAVGRGPSPRELGADGLRRRGGPRLPGRGAQPLRPRRPVDGRPPRRGARSRRAPLNAAVAQKKR